MIKGVYDVLLDDFAEFLYIVNKSGTRIRLTGEGNMQFEIVPMPILIGAFAKYRFILFPRPGRIIQFMRSIEMFNAGDVNHEKIPFGKGNFKTGIIHSEKPKFATMSILIVAATEQEIKPLLPNWSNADILITGVGIPSTVFHMMQHLKHRNYDRIYQVGIAGTFDKHVSLGSAYLIESDCFADLGVIENGQWHTMNQLGFSNPDDSPFNAGKLFNPHLKTIQLPTTTAATVNRLTDNKKEIELMRSSHGSQLESMEGAAFHYVALQLNIPFYQIRGISNLVGVRDKREWKIQEAIDASCTLFENLEYHLNQR